ncbi:MAG TPA: hypothetical protein RMH85_05460 [Polyangiaceae bacterium LLY-WYZ-15_(1-7)]|nr:hypothetical protein [Sandaracinus sp.]HJL05303.1 hypothetical protein [Polyangiaceae bacterium LLY-WYZ-15_(1-7)]HJL07921.1 hypothetical protein [Polyangiaceae bacterium LLY-WYZ-15_(1-7)]
MRGTSRWGGAAWIAGASALIAALVATSPARAQQDSSPPWIRRPPPTLTEARLGRWLDAGRRGVEACARTHAPDRALDVRARATAPAGTAPIALSVRAGRAPAAFLGCAEQALRRALDRRAGSVRRPRLVRASRRWRLPAGAHVAPPPRVDRAAVSAQVDRALTRQRAGLLRCFAGHSVPGALTLRIAVDPAGHLHLRGVEAPGGAAARRCLARVVAAQRIPRAPAASVVVAFRASLGPRPTR